MKSVKDHHQEEEEEDDEEFGIKKDVTTSNNNNKDGKSSDKVNALRSKHSVTEQRRRSKINERYQILRELIPDSDQKRDTASFLLEVIQYVQFLQEKVQKYEESYQPWNPEPTKLTPWRNSHWRVQSFSSHQPQAMKNGPIPIPVPTFPVRFDENDISIPPTIQPNPIETDFMRDCSGRCRSIDPQIQLPNKSMGIANMPVSITTDGALSHILPGQVSEAQSSGCNDTADDTVIEGGTINISTAYSEGLLNSLTQALHSTGLDLSQANISVQIDLGKRANRGITQGISIAKDPETSGNNPTGPSRDASGNEDFDHIQKRMKI